MRGTFSGVDTIAKPHRGSGITAFVDRPRPTGDRDMPHPIHPLGGPFRRWHLTPWKTTEASALLDNLGYTDEFGNEQEGPPQDTGPAPASSSGWGFLNNLVTQAGNVWGQPSRTPRPQPGPMIPRSSIGGSGGVMGLSTQTLLMVGAGLLGVYFLAKKK